MTQKLKYPVSEEYLIETGKLIFAPAKARESAWIIWFPGTGENIRIKQILSEKKVLKKVLGNYYKQFFLVPIEVSELLSIPEDEWIVLLFHKLFPFEKKESGEIHIEQLIKRIQNLIAEGKEPVFILYIINALPKEKTFTFLYLLHSIIEINRNRIHALIFISDHNLLETLHTDYFESLKTFFQNEIYKPLPTKDEIYTFTTYFNHTWKLQLSQKQIHQLKKFGGVYLLLKQGLRLYRQFPQSNIYFEKQSEILLRARSILTLLTFQQKSILQKIASEVYPHFDKDNQTIIDYFKLIGLIKVEGRRLKLTIPFLKDIILGQGEKSMKKLHFYRNKQKLFAHNLDLTKCLSPQEYQLLVTLFEQQESICSRDVLAQSIWKDTYIEKNSDWALDKLVSRLRQKLIDLYIFPNYIQTIRSQGFKLTTIDKI